MNEFRVGPVPVRHVRVFINLVVLTDSNVFTRSPGRGKEQNFEFSSNFSFARFWEKALLEA